MTFANCPPGAGRVTFAVGIVADHTPPIKKQQIETTEKTVKIFFIINY